jgi:hypothetical protein
MNKSEQNAMQVINARHEIKAMNLSRIEKSVTVIRENVTESSREERGPTGFSRDILHKAKGYHLDRLHSGQKVLEVIRWGRLILLIGGQDPPN